jgi:hypothetical protein
VVFVNESAEPIVRPTGRWLTHLESSVSGDKSEPSVWAKYEEVMMTENPQTTVAV